NLLEPAALGLPLLTGPHTFNAEDIAQLLISAGAAEIVTDADALGARVAELFADEAARRRIGAIGKSLVEANRGALSRLLALLEPVIAATEPASSLPAPQPAAPG